MELPPTLVRAAPRELEDRATLPNTSVGPSSIPVSAPTTVPSAVSVAAPLFTTFSHHPRHSAVSQEEMARAARLIDIAGGQRVLATVSGDVSASITPAPDDMTRQQPSSRQVSAPDAGRPGSSVTTDDGTGPPPGTLSSNLVTPSRDHPLGPEMRGLIEHLAASPEVGQLPDQRLLYRHLPESVPESGPGSTLGESPTYTPRIRTVLPHLLGVDSIWTTELELELLEFVEMCEDYAAECERTALSKHRWDTACRMLAMLCSGSAAVIPHIQNISTSAANATVSVIAAISLCASVAQSVYHFEKVSTTERNASFSLRETSKRIRMELAKPLPSRWPAPFEKMLQYEERFSEIARKISPKIIDNDVKSRIRTARRQRMRTRKRPEADALGRR